MFITTLQLTNFKRFTDLTVDLTSLAKPPKLVLLIGTNGSGKSSVFDAFEVIKKALESGGNPSFEDYKNLDESSFYYKKDRNRKRFFVDVLFIGGKSFSLKGGHDRLEINQERTNQQIIKINSFYGRSSLRQLPRLTRTGFSQKSVDFQKDTDRPKFYIDRDERFENDIEHIVKLILEDVFKNNAKTSREIIDRYIAPINQAFERVFGTSLQTSLRFYSLTPPTEGNTAEILFQKGEATVHYNLLSSGEKEIFNILFNLLSRGKDYQDTIYFLDELDLHLNTKLQYNLLKEITEYWLPANCQLWTASHSLGFIDYANETAHSTIVDFDDLNFDLPQILYPQPKNKLEIYEVAIPKETLIKLFKGKKIVICENQNDEYYNLLGLEDTIFVGVKNSRELFLTIKREHNYHGLRDRDYLTDNEINKLRQRFPQLSILPYYCFENYLYHPDNIAEISPEGFNKQAYLENIYQQKQDKLHYILPDIKMSRQNYEELKEEGIKDKDIDKLISDLGSSEFEVFYKYFDMKTKFNRQLLDTFNLSQKTLTQTHWFRNQIAKLLFTKS
ncbi:MAG: AAA family ATPase [Bacteroidota bacterium]